MPLLLIIGIPILGIVFFGDKIISFFQRINTLTIIGTGILTTGVILAMMKKTNKYTTLMILLGAGLVIVGYLL